MGLTLLSVKIGLLSFWSLWLLVVFLTNVFEGLKLLRIVPPYWKFASQNYRAVAQATTTYGAPEWIPQLLFAGVLVWQLGAVLLYGRVLGVTALTQALPLPLVNLAFAVSLGLLAAFMLADEFFQQYELERVHLLLFIAQLATLLALHLLPS